MSDLNIAILPPSLLLQSALDKGRVSLVLNIQIINPEGKDILKEKYSFEESEIESAAPPPARQEFLKGA